MAYPALFRNLFGDNPVRPFKFRKELIPLDVDKFDQWYEQMEAWRKSMIGCLVPTTMAALPGGFIQPDGSLVLFEDYPEFADAYESGAFDGMLLEADASAEDKTAWAGKWIKNTQGTGLYTPRLQGLFLRNGESIGYYNKPGLPGFSGELYPRTLENASSGQAGAIVGASGIFKLIVRAGGSSTAALSGGGTNYTSDSITVDPSRSSTIYGTSGTVMPASTDILYSLYLGKTA